MLPHDDDERIENEVPVRSSSKVVGEEDNEESKENQAIVSSQSDCVLKIQRKEQQQESEEKAKNPAEESKEMEGPSTTTPTEADDGSERKSDGEPPAKRSRKGSSSDEESKNSSSLAASTTNPNINNNLTLEEFTDIVLASEGFNQGSSAAVRVKPVVLAPRTNGNYHHHHHHSTSVTSSASVVVSVKPRVQRPPGRLHSGSALVEEWFRKMKPPLLKEEEQQAPPPPPPPAAAAMNLSLKSKPITLKPNKGPPSLSISRGGGAPYPKPPLSPPRLEVLRKIIVPPAAAKKRALYNKPDLVYADMMDAIKDRAVRDLHLAHTKDMHGNFPIHMSVLMRKPSLVRRYCCVLHILNSNVDLTNEDRYTALHLAVLDNSVEIVELLLSFGADPSIKDHRGNTCFHQAVAMKSNDCLKLLVEHLRTKEDLDCFNNSGFTALQIAIKKNDPASVHTLIQNGANLNIPENYKAPHCHLTPKNEHNKIMSERYLSLSRLH